MAADRAAKLTEDVRFSRPLLTTADASRHLGIPQRTFHRWTRGYGCDGPLFDVVEPESAHQASVPFIALVEAWVLAGLRNAGVRPQRVRPALTKLLEELGREHVLASQELATDGIAILWKFSRTEAGAGLIKGIADQAIMREIVQEYFGYVGFGSDNYPKLLRLKAFEPANVVIDPYRSSGQAVFDATGTKVANVAAILGAGEDPAIVAEEHGVDTEAVRAAARVLLGRAA